MRGSLRIVASLVLASPLAVNGMDVVVVGGGISGITAARTIADNWPPTEEPLVLTVIEATNRVGGRAFTGTDEMSNWNPMVGAELDFGSSFLQAPGDDQPVKLVADKLFLTGVSTSSDNVAIYRCSKGDTDKCPLLDDDGSSDLSKLLKAAKAQSSNSTEDISVWDALAGLSTGGGRDDPVIQFQLMKLLEFNLGASPTNLSIKHFKDTADLSGNGTILKTGHGKVPQGMRDGMVKIKINCQEADPTSTPTVEAVPNGVRVPLTTVMNQQVVQVSELGTDRLQVITKDGTVFGADHVIMAVPLGVLKKNVITFDPPLSDDKLTAISRLGFNNVVKVGLLFDQAFWDTTKDFFGVIQPPGMANAEKFSYFLNGFSATGRPFLMTYVFGPSAEEVESWTDDQVWSAIQTNLIAAFGAKTVNAAQNLQMWRSYWGKDPYFYGAYAAQAPGSLPEDWAAMNKSQSRGRLHFAGEIASTQYPGTVRGAFVAGQAAACEVLKDPVPRPQIASLLSITHMNRKWGKQRGVVSLEQKEHDMSELLHGKAQMLDDAPAMKLL